MASESLATYLNDHLAGSVVALELLDGLETERAGTPDAPILARLRTDIVADRDELTALMARLGIEESRPRQATAWLLEKVSDLKMRIDDPGGGALRRLETLETISLGIEGKRLLADALATAVKKTPALAGFDTAGLARRAGEQRAVVETMRVEAAREALGAAG